MGRALPRELSAFCFFFPRTFSYFISFLMSQLYDSFVMHVFSLGKQVWSFTKLGIVYLGFSWATLGKNVKKE